MDFNKIQQSRITPIDPVKKVLNNNLDKDSHQDKSFEELLEKAMRNGPTNTDNIGMDPDTMAMIVASTKAIDSIKDIAPKHEEIKNTSNNENYNQEVASIIASSTNVTRFIPKNPYGGNSKK